MAISLVQSASNTGAGTAASVTVTLGANTTAGNCLVVCSGDFQNSVNPTISGITLGGAAGNFASANTAHNNADNNADIWTDRNCAGGQTSVVVSYSGGGGGGGAILVYVLEFSGVDTVSPLDTHPAGQNGNAASWSSGSTGVLAQANEVAIGVICTSGTGLTTPSSPWTELTQLSASSTLLGVGYQVVAATTALTYNGTSTANIYGCCIVTLKAAAGGGARPSALLLKFP